MDVVDEFLERYARERDYYARAATIARDLLEARLFEEGVRAIVSARAKAVNRLRDKLRKRTREEPFALVEEVRASIVDLAGARGALYFPGDRYSKEIVVWKYLRPDTAPNCNCLGSAR